MRLGGGVRQKYLDLYDKSVHGFIDRREFLGRLTTMAASSAAALAVFDTLSPSHALASQVAERDPDIAVRYQQYDSPLGVRAMRTYLAEPTDTSTSLSAVVVIHENRGLNPYVDDVARGVAKAGMIAFAPDALTPLGGYPGIDRCRVITVATEQWAAWAFVTAGVRPMRWQ